MAVVRRAGTLGPMYAQLIEGGTTPERRAEMDRIVTGEMVPALRGEPGFAGALNLVDRDSGNAMMIVLWESEPQARRALSDYGSAFLKAPGALAAIPPGPRRPITVWAVNARACRPPRNARAARPGPPPGRARRSPRP